MSNTFGRPAQIERRQHLRWFSSESPKLRVRVLLLAVAVTVAASVGAILATRSSADAPCPAGMPLFKCVPGGPLADSTNNPQSIPNPPAYWPSPAIVGCAQSFFAPSIVTKLEAKFGTLTCFRFDNDKTWIVSGDGMNIDGSGPASVGAMVAVDNCAGTSTCGDPTAEHNFSDFTVSYPPDPAAWPMRIETSFGTALLHINDSSCNVFNFNIHNLHWLDGSSRTVDAVLGSHANPPAFAAAAQEAGTTALARPTRPASTSCTA